jgi:hypothetical protein
MGCYLNPHSKYQFRQLNWIGPINIQIRGKSIASPFKKSNWGIGANERVYEVQPDRVDGSNSHTDYSNKFLSSTVLILFNKEFKHLLCRYSNAKIDITSILRNWFPFFTPHRESACDIFLRPWLRYFTDSSDFSLAIVNPRLSMLWPFKCRLNVKPQSFLCENRFQ